MYFSRCCRGGNRPGLLRGAREKLRRPRNGGQNRVALAASPVRSAPALPEAVQVRGAANTPSRSTADQDRGELRLNGERCNGGEIINAALIDPLLRTRPLPLPLQHRGTSCRWGAVLRGAPPSPPGPGSVCEAEGAGCRGALAASRNQAERPLAPFCHQSAAVFLFPRTNLWWNKYASEPQALVPPRCAPEKRNCSVVPALKGESASCGASPDARETRQAGVGKGSGHLGFFLFFPEIYVK